MAAARVIHIVRLRRKNSEGGTSQNEMLRLKNLFFRLKTSFLVLKTAFSKKKNFEEIRRSIKKDQYENFRKIPVFRKSPPTTTPQLFSARLRGMETPTHVWLHSASMQIASPAV